MAMPQEKYTQVVKMFNKKHCNKNLYLHAFSRVFFYEQNYVYRKTYVKSVWISLIYWLWG